MSRLKVACAGTGYFSQFHYDGWSRLPVKLVGCCSLDDQARGRVADTHGIPATFTDFAAMLDKTKPDLVDIITPPPTHKAFVTAAMERGIPAICQKPFCNTLEEAQELTNHIAEAGATVIVHENFRFQPWHLELKRLIDDGLVGELYQISFRLRPGDGQGLDAYLSRQPYFQKMSRFLVHETAIHLIDVFRFLIGEAQQVTADLRQLNPAISGEDAGIILFDFGEGRRGLFDGNRLSDHPAENRRLTMGEMLVEGSEGALSLNGDGGIQRRKRGENVWHPHSYDWENVGFAGDCVWRLQAHVLAHLTDGAPVHNTARDYLTNLRIEDAVYRSSEEGRRIAL